MSKRPTYEELARQVAELEAERNTYWGIGTVPEGRENSADPVSEALRHTERELKLFQSVINRASFACYWIGHDARFAYVNDRACESLGYSRDELLNMAVEDVDPSYPPEIWIAFWQRLLKDRVVTFESTHRRKSNEQFSVEITANYVAFEDREYSCAYVNDLTERKAAEKALRENEERLRQAIRVSNIGIFDHNHIANTVFWSPLKRKIHGWEPDEPVNLEAFLSLVHPEDLKAIEAEVQRAHDPSSDGFWDVEHRIIRRDGTIRWLKARSQTFFEGEGADRHPVRTVGAVQDVTEEVLANIEREKLQAQLSQAQKMESVGRLAGGVAHDFNNMLTVILGHTELLLGDVESESPFRGDLEEIKSAARRSADLTRQLLAFARRQTIAPRALDLNDAMEESLKMLRRLIGEDITLDWIPSRNLWRIMADPVQLDQILANLLVNARDAIMVDGTITIETHNVEFSKDYCDENPGAVPGQFVLLAVSDNGCGMDEETLSHIFEPFYTTKECGQGTGLGLATVYGIVKQNSGFMKVYSEVDKGSTFNIYLPRHANETESIILCAESHGFSSGTETILLVEDDLMVLRLCMRILKGLGYTVLSAATPTEAIRIANESGEHIDLLVTDVVMPEMNGRDLALRLMRQSPKLKCLFTSGYTANVIARHGILDEGANFLQKPMSRTQLAAKVREVLNGA